MKTYDIINAGPNNRFMANGRIVSNSGSIVQLQNLYRNSMPDLAQARALVKQGNYDALEALYESVPEVLAQCVRTAFIPAPGYKFIVSDFSAIEARVLSWLAGEQWRMDAFARGDDIYCASASQMFGVPVEKHGINGHLRQKGKIAELALGFGGSVGALKAMGALDMGLAEDELSPLVAAWRQANQKIVQFWWAVDRAVTDAVTRKTTTKTHGLVFSCRNGMLFITLPSGRNLAYVKPRIGENKFGGTCITYEGIGGTKKWERIDSYGPKFVENCIAKGTWVITARGLVAIEDIRADDKVWDGIEYVSHDGLIYQGIKNVNNVNNILMTPDHKILTERGWKRNAESDGLNWAAVSLPDGTICPIADISVISTGLTKPVYDIRNCGPRHRFAVWANGRAYIVSNCVQGIARDILCYAMKTLRCCNIVMHIHDELVIEVDRGVSLQAVCEQMSRTPPWAEGLQLRADGYECDFYKKD